MRARKRVVVYSRTIYMNQLHELHKINKIQQKKIIKQYHKQYKSPVLGLAICDQIEVQE